MALIGLIAPELSTSTVLPNPKDSPARILWIMDARYLVTSLHFGRRRECAHPVSAVKPAICFEM